MLDYTLTQQYEILQLKMSKEFYKRYFWDSEEEYSDLDADYYRECYMIWSSSKRWRSPSWPLDIREWMYIFNINDIRTALERDIPKNILIDWYDKHQDWYNFDDFWKVNLWHYYRQNHDPEVYAKEQEIELDESRLRSLESSYLLDDALWIDRWTSYKKMQDTINNFTLSNTNEYSSSESIEE